MMHDEELMIGVHKNWNTRYVSEHKILPLLSHIEYILANKSQL